MLRSQKLRASIVLADGRRLGTLSDVHELFFAMDEQELDNERILTVLRLLESAKDQPSRDTLRSLQESLWIMLKTKRLI